TPGGERRANNKRCADDGAGSAEASLPQPVADDSHWAFRSAAAHIVGRRERTADECRHAKSREEVTAGVQPVDRLHLVALRQVVLVTRPRECTVEHLGSLPNLVPGCR